MLFFRSYLSWFSKKESFVDLIGRSLLCVCCFISMNKKIQRPCFVRVGCDCSRKKKGGEIMRIGKEKMPNLRKICWVKLCGLVFVKGLFFSK